MRQFIALALLAFVAFTLLQSKQVPPLPDGSKPVPTETNYHATPTTPRVDGEIVVKDPAGAELGRWYLDAGRVYAPPNSGRPGVNLELIRHQYLYDPGFDIGTFAGYGGGDLPHFQVGVRLSPVRLAWGVLAPDVAFTSTAAGVGLSAYPPAAYFGR